jgi:hypothetical protein
MLPLRVSVAAACRGAAAHAAASKRAGAALARAGRAGPPCASAPRPALTSGLPAAAEAQQERAPVAPAEWWRANLDVSRLSVARFSSAAASGQVHAAAIDELAWMTWEGETDLQRRIPWEKSPDATQSLTASVRGEDGEKRITSDHGVMLLRTKTPLLVDEESAPLHFSRRCMREMCLLTSSGT